MTMTSKDVSALIEKHVAICETCGHEIVQDGREHICAIWEGAQSIPEPSVEHNYSVKAYGANHVQ